MTRKTSRTPAEIAQELQARADAAKLRAAKAEAQTSPAIAYLNNMVNIATNARNKAKALASKTDSRIEALDLRKAWILAEHNVAQAEIIRRESQIQALKSQAMAFAEAIANGGNLTEQDAVDAVESISLENFNDAIVNAKRIAEAAEKAWRNANKNEKQMEAGE